MAQVVERIGILSDPSPVHVDRKIPIALQGHIDLSEWESFCNKMDMALLPVDSAIKLCSKVQWIGMAVVAMGIPFVVLFLSFYIPPSLTMGLVYSFILYPIAKFASSRNLKSKVEEAHSQLDNICMDMTEKSPMLRFAIQRPSDTVYYARRAQHNILLFSVVTTLKSMLVITLLPMIVFLDNEQWMNLHPQ